MEGFHKATKYGRPSSSKFHSKIFGQGEAQTDRDRQTETDRQTDTREAESGTGSGRDRHGETAGTRDEERRGRKEITKHRKKQTPHVKHNN